MPAVLAVGLLLGACSAEMPVGAPSNADPSPGPTGVAPEPSTASRAPTEVARCADDPGLPAAPSSWYKDSPVYDDGKQPFEVVRAWAANQPGFQHAWIDAERNGWITLAFDRPVDDLQGELEARFAGDGVVAVEVTWDHSELVSLRRRVTEAVAATDASASVDISIAEGRVRANVQNATEQVVETLASFLPGPVCVRIVGAVDPTDTAPGWRLLVIDGPARRTTESWATVKPEPRGGLVLGTRVELATTPQQERASWKAGLGAVDGALGWDIDPPSINFAREVVVFGHMVEQRACPIEVVGVVVDETERTVTVATRGTEEIGACGTDQVPVSWSVAIERTLLPPAPFTLIGPRHDGPAELLVATDLRVARSSVADDATIARAPGSYSIGDVRLGD